jgi:diguanylate cyclase (GGDEF)-like protein/PAS domain S-box-containing protein
LLIFAGVASTALLQIRVNSPLYKSISLSNNLIADYVPPYESLMEPARLCGKLVDAPDQESRQHYEQELKAFQRENEARYADYMVRVPEGELKDRMRGEARQTAQEYFKLADQLVALVNANRGDEARALLASTMNPLYIRHAAAVDQIVIRAKQEALAAEDLAARSVSVYTAAMVTIGLLILILEGALSWFLARGISAQADCLSQSEHSLSESEELYRSTFDQAAVGILHVAFDGRILRCNLQFAEIIGYPIEEIPGKFFQQFTPPEYRSESAEALRLLVTGAKSATGLEKPYLRKDGTLTWVKLTSSVQTDHAGQPLHLVAFMQDINERKAAEQHLATATSALQRSESLYRTVFQTSRDALSIARKSDAATIEANQTFLRMLGFEREELIGKSALSLGIWADLKDREKILHLLFQNGSFQNEQVQLRKKNGEIFWTLVSAYLIEVEGVTCGYFITRDISDVKAAEDQIRDLAFYDRVTHIPNRRLLLDRLQQSISGDSRSNSKKAVLFVDLDDFKNVNETLGHQAGDHLLQQLAQRLTASVHESDTVARFGADEFVVILEGLNDTAEDAAKEAGDLSESILAALRQPYLLADHDVHCTASIGIAVFGDERESPNEVMQRAGIAMSEAKSAGGDTARFYAPALQAAVNNRAAMKDDISQAINAKQFILYYQPQVDSTGLIGAEALVRWKHPVRGIVPPFDFIPLAEETGLILPIGNLVLETACTQIAAWTAQNILGNVQIAVNISARQFAKPDFVEYVLDVLARTGANPANLQLELTESMLANNMKDVIAKMTALRSHGLSLALDDFGTGYSSLSYLKHLPLDQLKIDRAFVQDILEDVASASIAQTVISLGRAMGLSVIAEGVETDAQREFLLSLGTHSFQGYFYSRPLPQEDFERLWLAPAKSVNPASHK